MRRIFSAVFILFSSLAVLGQETKINPSGMKTQWGEKVTAQNAWRAYPRPQLGKDRLVKS